LQVSIYSESSAEGLLLKFMPFDIFWTQWKTA